MLRKTSTLAIAALMTSASIAAAEEHVIFYLGDAFFPEVTYVDAGDTIRFLNSSTSEMTVVSLDEEWSVGPVGIDESQTLAVSGGMTLKFFDATAADADGESEAEAVEGELSFEPAPLG